jgi:hypothetical protein
MTLNSFRRALSLAPFAAALAFALVQPRAALAERSSVGCVAAPSHAWTLAWRPNWLPGDPWMDESAPTFVRAADWAPGLIIAIDPETKRPVMPTPEQRRALSDAMERGGALGAPVAPDAPLRVEKIPGGGEVTYLDGRFQVYVVARRDANGRIVTDCAPDGESAKRLVTQPTPTPAREDR